MGLIGDEGAKALASDLEVNRVLTKLNMDGFDLNITQLKGIDPVKKLDLSRKRLGVASGIAIAKALEVNAVLTSCDLAGNSIGVDGAKALASALEVNAVLTTLGLGSNKIGPEGATAIAKALEVNRVLKLKKLVVGRPENENAELKTICVSKGVEVG